MTARRYAIVLAQVERMRTRPKPDPEANPARQALRERYRAGGYRYYMEEAQWNGRQWRVVTY